MEISFWQINRFKVIFVIVFMAITAMFFFLGNFYLITPLSYIVLGVFYVPGTLAEYFSHFFVTPCAKDLCALDPTAWILFMIVFSLIYMYLLACIADKYIVRKP